MNLAPGKPTMRELVQQAIADASRAAKGHTPTVFVPDDEAEPDISSATRAKLLGVAVARATHGA